MKIHGKINPLLNIPWDQSILLETKIFWLHIAIVQLTMTLPKCNFLVTHFQIFFVAINIPANDRQNINTFVPARYPTKQVFFLIQFIMIGGGLGSRGCTNLESGWRRGFNFCQKGFVPHCNTQSSFWVKMKMFSWISSLQQDNIQKGICDYLPRDFLYKFNS